MLLENSALLTEVKKSEYKEFSAQAERTAGTYTPANPIVAPHSAMNVKEIHNIATPLHNKHWGEKQNLIWKEFQLGFAVGKDVCSERGCKYCQGDTKRHFFFTVVFESLSPAGQKYGTNTKICAWHTHIPDIMTPPANHRCTLDVCVLHEYVLHCFIPAVAIFKYPVMHS